MKARLLIGFSLLLAGSPFAACAAPAGDLLIIPGKRIGLTPLGPQGSRTLAHMAKPYRADAAMSQRFLVWIAGPYTLFIHTASNGALNVKPLDGVTIDAIRVTSPYYHTREAQYPGDGAHVGSTLAQVRHWFPRVRSVNLKTDSATLFYDDSRSGIAFEFDRPAAPNSRTIAVMIHPPGSPCFADARQVRDLLQEPPP